MDTQTTRENSPTPASQKAVLTLTPAAVAQVKTVIAREKLEGHYLAVRVVPAGCSGMGYDLNLVGETKPGDIVTEQEGIKIVTDALSEQMLAGTVVDYVTSIQGAGFKFENPNAKSTCGCGTSFSA